jgi:hypothetical protein
VEQLRYVEYVWIVENEDKMLVGYAFLEEDS